MIDLIYRNFIFDRYKRYDTLSIVDQLYQLVTYSFKGGKHVGVSILQGRSA